MAQRFILVRHGVTDWNLAKRYQGHTDIPLNDTGREQANQTARLLQDIPIDAIYTSDLARAYQTADIIAKGRNSPVYRLKSLRETNFGQWEGLTIEEIHQQYPEQVELMKKEPIYGIRPGGESRAMMYERVEKTIDRIIEKHPNRSIAIVSHQGTLGAAVCAITGEDFNEGRKKYRLGNTGYHILEKIDGNWQISHFGEQEEILFKS